MKGAFEPAVGDKESTLQNEMFRVSDRVTLNNDDVIVRNIYKRKYTRNKGELDFG